MRNEEKLPLIPHDKGTYAKLTESLEKCPDQVAIAKTFVELMKKVLRGGILPSHTLIVVQETYSKPNIEQSFYVMLAGGIVGSFAFILHLNIDKSEDRKKLNNFLEKILESDAAIALVGMAIPIAVRIAGIMKPGQWGNSVASNIVFLSSVLSSSLLIGFMNLPVMRRFIYNNFKDKKPRWLHKVVKNIDQVLRDYVTFYQLLEIVLFFGNVFKRPLVLQYNEVIGLTRLLLAGAAAIVSTVTLEGVAIKKPEIETEIRERFKNSVANPLVLSIFAAAINNIISMAEEDRADENRSNRALIAGLLTAVVIFLMLAIAGYLVQNKKSKQIQEKNIVERPKEQKDKLEEVKVWIENFEAKSNLVKEQLSSQGAKQENSKESKEEEKEQEAPQERKPENNNESKSEEAHIILEM